MGVSCKILTMRAAGFLVFLVVVMLPADLLGLPLLSKLLSRISIRRVERPERREGKEAALVDPNYGVVDPNYDAPSSSASPLYDAPSYTTTVTPCSSYAITTTTTTTEAPSYRATTGRPFPDILGFLRRIPEGVVNHFKPTPPPYSPCLSAPQILDSEPYKIIDTYQEPKDTYQEPKETYQPRINEIPEREETEKEVAEESLGDAEASSFFV